MIHEEICTYEVCKLAKGKGFDVPTHFAYNENCQKAMYMELCLNRNTKDSHSISAPTQSLLQRWLREEKGVVVLPYLRTVLRNWSATCETLPPCKNLNKYKFVDLKKSFPTYELALEDALKYALENLV